METKKYEEEILSEIRRIEGILSYRESLSDTIIAGGASTIVLFLTFVALVIVFPYILSTKDMTITILGYIFITVVLQFWVFIYVLSTMTRRIVYAVLRTVKSETD